MGTKRIGRLPVVENNRLVGMLALGDVVVRARHDIEISDMLTVFLR
jgi:CBS domain-containing protein